MYSSYRQCVENARVGCVANPAIDPLPTAPGSTIFMLAQPMHHGSRHGWANRAWSMRPSDWYRRGTTTDGSGRLLAHGTATCARFL